MYLVLAQMALVVEKVTMLTLALGQCKLQPLKYEERGFTLLELMVVLVVFGISLSLVTPHFMKNDDDVLKEESMRLVALMEYAADLAGTEGHWLAWNPTVSGYRFLQRDDDKNVWQPIITDEVLRERQLPEGVHIMSANSQQAIDSSRTMIALSPSGIHAPFRIELAVGKSKRVVRGDLLGKVEVSNPNLRGELAL
jgi:general secretion pathway protein H